MLRAELARKSPQQASENVLEVTTPAVPFGQVVEIDAIAAVGSTPTKPARKPRATTTKKPTAKAAPVADETAAKPAPAKRATRPRTTKAATAGAGAAEAPAEEAPAAEAKKPTRRRTTKSAPAAEEG